MDACFKNDLKDLAINQLMHTLIGENLQQAELLVEKIKSHYFAIMEKQDEAGITSVKALTIITFAVLKKIAGGKKPSEFDTSDWKDIAKDVSDFVILPSDQAYSVFIFGLYEKYIRYSVKMINGIVLPGTVKTVNGLADELQDKAKDLKSGRISEVKYTEDCLWISLEAMVKLLASTAILFGDEGKAEYAQAIASYAFEYGRLMLYKKEQEIVDSFIESQYQMDAELEAQYSAYLEDLQKESKQFHMLIDNAFSPDCKSAFLQSILLAKAASVEETEILSCTEDIDAFFLL